MPSVGLRGASWLALAAAPAATTLLAACRGDGGTGPTDPPLLSVAGTYFGFETLQPAGCTPALPPTEPAQRALTLPRLLVVTQSGVVLTGAGLGGAGTAMLNGTVTAEGAATFVGVATVPGQRGAVSSNLTIRMTYRPITGAGSTRLTGPAQVTHEERDTETNVLVRTCSWEGATDLARRTDPVPEVAPRACADEPALRAQPAGDRELLVVRNTTARPVTVYWRNAQGQRVRMLALNAGYDAGIPSSIGDPYVVTDEAGQCVGVFVVSTAGPSSATLR
jgi:hypothetical protein